MGWLDSLLPWRAKEAGRREAESSVTHREREFSLRSREAMLSAIRHFQSATEDRRRPNWWSMSFSGDAEGLAMLPMMRSRSRLMVDNDAKAGGLVHKEVVNVIGPRVTVHPHIPETVWRDLNLTDRQCEEYVSAAGSFWKERVANPAGRDFDWRRMRNWLQITRLRFRHFRTDGELFVRYQMRPDRKSLFTCQIIEPECIGTPPGKASDPRVKRGIQFADSGEMEGFWVAVRSDGPAHGASRYEFVPARNEYGLPQMVFYYDPWRESASYGLPWLQRVLVLLNDVADYKDSELQRKKLEADIGLFITLQRPEDFEDGVGDLGFHGSGTAEKKRSEITWKKGQVWPLEPGEGIHVVDPSRPGSIYQPFLDSHDRDIGNGIGRSFERASNNYGAANFSATRVSGIEDFVEHETDFELFAGTVLNADWEWAMWAQSVTSGDPVFRNIAARWQRYVKPSWDPLVDAESANERIDAGISSVVEEAALLGRNYAEVQDNALTAEARLRMRRQEMGLPESAPGDDPTVDAAVEKKVKKAVAAAQAEAEKQKPGQAAEDQSEGGEGDAGNE